MKTVVAQHGNELNVNVNNTQQLSHNLSAEASDLCADASAEAGTLWCDKATVCHICHIWNITY